jgi:serine/threonine-protein kinase HipA
LRRSRQAASFWVETRVTYRRVSLSTGAAIWIAQTLRRVCDAPEENTRELFRRMCFNALISNVDDHPRNHAILAKSVSWRLSPAYDLTPSVPISLEQRDLAMACGDAGRLASAENLLSQRARFLLDDEDARGIVDAMEAQVRATWYTTARAAGVSERDCERIARAFAYDGFRRTSRPA